MKETKIKYYCDICNKEITNERSKKKTILKAVEEWLLSMEKLKSYYHYGTDKIDICNNCMVSFKFWQKSRKGE